MDERAASISRREALKSTAKIAGVAAFAAPVVVGVFSAQSVGASHCGPNDSDSQLVTIGLDNFANTNCGNKCNDSGEYHSDFVTSTIPNSVGPATVTITVAEQCAQGSAFVISATGGYVCQATFQAICASGDTEVPQNGTLLPYCTGPTTGSAPCASAKLLLVSAHCCSI